MVSADLAPADRVLLQIADVYGLGPDDGRRAAHIRAATGLSEVAWAQRVRRLVWSRPDVEAALPVLVHRLRRQMPRGGGC